MERAKAKIAEGDSFGALRHLDRALAYAPDDASVLALVDQATEANTGKSTRWFVPSAWSRKRVLAAALGGTGAILVPAVIAAVWVMIGTNTPETTVAAVSSEAPVLAASASTAPTASTAPEPPKAVRPIEGLARLDPSRLPNDGPKLQLDSIANDTRPVRGKGTSKEDHADAVARALAAASAKPGDPDAALGLAAALLAAGKTEEGSATIDELLEKHPDYAKGWYIAGYVDLRKGDVARAEARISRAIELSPRHADALRVRGIIRHRTGRIRDGYADLMRSLELEPDAPGTLAELAHIYANASRGKEALPLLRRLVDVAPTNADVWIDLAQVVDDPDEAIRSANRAIELKPRSARAHRVLCRRMVEFEKPGAMPVCNKAIALAKKHPEAYMLRGLIKARNKRNKEALVDLDKAVSLDPMSPNLRFNRHLVRGRVGDLKGAAEDLRVACKGGHAEACETLDEMVRQ